MMKYLLSILFAACFSYNLSAFTALNNSTINSSIDPMGKSVTLFCAKKKKWVKDVWSIIEIDQKINTPIFHPFNDKMPGYDYSNFDIKSELFETQKESIHWNLWTIIMRHFFKGELMLYSAYDPEWMDNRDDGFLSYPISPEKYGLNSEGTFETDSKFREAVEEMGCVLQIYNDPYAVPLLSWLYPDEDSVILNEKTGYYEAVYPPSDYIWYEDKDIVSYRIKEKWTLDENGHVQDKAITAIAPTIIATDMNGNEVGKRELFWIDYTQLAPIITTYFIMLDRYKKERIISLKEFFNTREFYASPVAKAASHVQKMNED